MGRWCQVALCVVVAVLVCGVPYTVSSSCNEAVCASLVSKCMLLKSCECNMLDKDNCTCCKDCHKCLATLYTECCSCVGMCPGSSSKPNLHKRSSTIEELDEPVPALFSVLTEEEDELLRWATYTYPAHLDLRYFLPRGHSLDLDLAASFTGEDGTTIRHGRHRISTHPHADTTNCTVAYMAQCMSLSKCRDSCESMGAARFRWFHEYGCCECIGSTCLDYGKGEALCLHCPVREEDEEEESPEEVTVGGVGGLAGTGLLDKEIRVDNLASRTTEENVEDLLEEPAASLSGGRLDSASLSLGDEAASTTKKHRKAKHHGTHHGKN